ncbi:MAG TPA: lysylphosphatidylglycerol synthase transmembrane domain-containing protein [Candidatus Saccharimonadales bacterium]|nr:lysylphosphatidylglycerol synthase transmembrane domain-containing protein [Candidatus Saccharimonadales bacterium]
METHQELQVIKRSKWRLILTAVTFIALAVLIYGVRKDIGGVIENLGKVNTLALLLIIPIEAINYDVYARFYVRLFKILDKRVRYRDMYKLNLELNFVNHILPSGGVSGISYFTVRMRAYGVSGPKATLSQLMKLLVLFISFQPLLVVGVFLLALRGHVNDLVMFVASSIITLLVVGTFGFIYMIESRHRINSFLTTITKIINKLLSLVRRQPETINIAGAQTAFGELHDNYQLLKENWRQLKLPFVYLMIANLTEVAAIYVVYVAFGRLVNVGAVVLAYAVANFAGLISVLPAGIGVYEGLMTAVLVATGIPAGLSIPVTIMYRVINMAIQLTPGYYFYQRALRGGLDKTSR